MSQRFTCFWKQLFPEALGSSDITTPYGIARYRSLFSSGPLSEKNSEIGNVEEMTSSSARKSKAGDPCFLEDLVG